MAAIPPNIPVTTSISSVTPTSTSGIRDLSHLVPVPSSTISTEKKEKAGFYDSKTQLHVFPSHMGNLAKLGNQILIRKEGGGEEIILKGVNQEFECTLLPSGKVSYEGKEFANLKSWIHYLTLHHFVKYNVFDPTNMSQMTEIQKKENALLLNEFFKTGENLPKFNSAIFEKKCSNLKELGQIQYPSRHSVFVVEKYRKYFSDNPDVLNGLEQLPSWLIGLPDWLNRALLVISPQYKDLKESQLMVRIPASKEEILDRIKKDGVLPHLNDYMGTEDFDFVNEIIPLIKPGEQQQVLYAIYNDFQMSDLEALIQSGVEPQTNVLDKINSVEIFLSLIDKHPEWTKDWSYCALNLEYASYDNIAKLIEKLPNLDVILPQSHKILEIALKEGRYSSKLEPFLEFMVARSLDFPINAHLIPAPDMIKVLSSNSISEKQLSPLFKNYYFRGYPNIHEIFTQVFKNRPPTSNEDFRFLLDFGFEKDARLFIKFFEMQNDKKCIDYAVQNVCEPALVYLMELGMDISRIDLPEHCLSLRRILGQPAPINPEETWKYLLQSNLSEIWPNLEDYDRDRYGKMLCVISRNPSIKSQNLMVQVYGSGTYSDMQLNYAEGRVRQLNALIGGMQRTQIGFFDAHLLLSHRRGKDFETFRETGGLIPDVTTEISGRYSVNLPFVHFAQSCGDPEIVKDQKGYVVKHTLSTGEVVELTWVEFDGKTESEMRLNWVHTQPRNFRPILDEMSRMFGELQNRDLPKDEWEKKLVEFYWLGCHACPTKRGNAQYMLELLNALRISRGLEPLIPARHPTPFPDCAALCLSKGEFAKVFDSLFEKTGI